MTATSKPPIAVVGLSCLFPGSPDERGFWHDILAGRDLISDVPPQHWLIDDFYDADPKAPDKTYAKRGGFLSPVDFDPLGWGVPPSIIPATDTAQLLALIVAQRVLDEACQGQFATMDKERVSVILGVTSAQELLGSMVARLQRPIWVKSMREAGLPESVVQEACERISDHYTPWQEATFPGLLGNVVAGRIANRLDIAGTNCVTDAACASAFAAASMAVNELYLGDSDLVVTGGVDVLNDIFMYMCFSKTPALSATGDCRPFSDQADGTMLGEGLGMVALKRLEDAERDGDRIYAVLRGIGSSSDGRAKSVYAPLPSGQAKALRRAYDKAGFGPDTVELLEAHGTGTKAGDKAEFEGLQLVFGEHQSGGRKQWCALGSVKSQIGHTKAAAGSAGLFKAVMALHHKVLPPTIKIERPNPGLNLEDGAFSLSTTARPWVRGSDHPRRAGVSSFGFGGSNFHIATEEYVGPGKHAARKRVTGHELVVFGGADVGELVAALGAALDRARGGAAGVLARLAWETAGIYDATAAHRVGLVAVDEADLAAKLEQAVALVKDSGGRPKSAPNGVHYGVGPHSGEVAFLFPGQGSQYLAMGADVAMHWPEALTAWDLAADLELDPHLRLHEVVFPTTAFDAETAKNQAARLARTEWAQPAIGATSLAYFALTKTLGITPASVAGHSFGEVTALHAAGAFDAATMLRVARRRGELMAEAAASDPEAATNPGTMTAVVADIATVREVLKQAGVDAVVANHNSPEQVVISGRTDAVIAVEKRLKDDGIRFTRLPVATAFHSEVVAGAAGPFGKFLASLKVAAPKLSVWANSQAAPYARKPKAVRETLAGQLTQPVRFVEQLEAMYAAGARTFIEVGPNRVLTGLSAKILGAREHRAIALDRKGRSGVASLHEGLAELVAVGVPMTLRGLWQHHDEPADPAAIKRPKLAIGICGANHGKPYPPKGGTAALPGPNPEKQPEVVIREVIREVTREVPSAALSGQTSAPQPVVQGDSWLGAFRQTQAQTARAHNAWQGMMADAHMAFLSTSEQGLASLREVIGGAGSGGGSGGGLSVDERPSDERPTSITAATAAQSDVRPTNITTQSDVRPTNITAATAAQSDVRPTNITTQSDVRPTSITTPTAAPKIGRFVVRAIDAPAAGLALAGIGAADTIDITDDGNGVAAALVTELQTRGLRAAVVQVPPADSSAVVVLDGLVHDADHAQAAAISRQVFRHMRTVANKMSDAAGGVAVVVQNTGGDFGLSGHRNAWLGGLAGLAKTAAVEWPNATVRAIDLAIAGRSPAELAVALADELVAGGAEREVGLQPGRRLTLTALPADVSGAQAAIEPGDVIVASGGARGVTAATLIALAQAAQPKLVLLGRTPMQDEPAACAGAVGDAALKKALLDDARATGNKLAPAELGALVRGVLGTREIRATIAAIEQAGGAARYISLDVTDTVAVSAALSEVRAAWGPIRGVVHGAGVLADKLLADKTDAQFDRVFDTKVRGLKALLDATANDDLRLCVLFSSVAARAGNQGQCDYAMANEALNKVAWQLAAQRPTCKVRALGWGPWQGGMVTPALAAHFESAGVALIPLQVGAQMLVDEVLLDAGNDIELVIGDKPGRAGLGAADPRPTERFAVLVSSISYPHLRDHTVRDVPVVPAMQVADWFARAARATRGDLKLARLRDLRVHKGIELHGFDGDGDRFVVTCRQLANSEGAVLALELRDAVGTLRYGAQADMVDSLTSAPRATPAVDGDGQPWPTPVYGGVLFHGAAFAVLSDVRATGDGLLAATQGSRQKGWKSACETLGLDVAMLDGALQAALLFTEKALGGGSLPTAIDTIELHPDGAAGLPDAGPATCALTGRTVGANKAVTEIALTTADGRPLVSLRGVQTFLLPAPTGARASDHG